MTIEVHIQHKGTDPAGDKIIVHKYHIVTKEDGSKECLPPHESFDLAPGGSADIWIHGGVGFYVEEVVPVKVEAPAPAADTTAAAPEAAECCGQPETCGQEKLDEGDVQG